MSPASAAGAESAAAAAPAAIDRQTRDLRLIAARFALPVIFVVFIVFFSAVRPDTFATNSNFKSIVTNQAVLGILSIGLILPLVVGRFDLSVAANLGLAAIVVTGLPAKSGVALVPAVIIALLLSSGIGLFNGVMVAKGGLNSLVVTLAMSSVVTGAVQWYTNGNVIYEGIPHGLTDITQGSVLGIPLPGIYLLVLAIVAWFLLEQTAVGRYLYATGGSEEASRLSGIKVDRLTIGAFVGAGFLAGVAGVVQASLLGTGNPTVGPPFLLQAFAAVFLGATTIKLATFNVIGTVIAVFTIAVGITGLQLMGVAFYVAPVFQGVALLIAIAAVRLLRREAI